MTLNKLTQICVYADDILVTARNFPALEALCAVISREAGRVGQVINPDMTKYVKFSASPSRSSVKRATIHGVTYEGAVEFIYLGTLISNDIIVEKELQIRILAGYRTYFAAISFFRSQLLSRATKSMLYKAPIRPVVSYGAEAWTLKE